mgnify:FL=1
MSFSVLHRRIASNLFWSPAGFVRHPLVEIDSRGRVLSVVSCPDPDRLPFVEFRSGLFVPDFPVEFRAAFAALPADTPLSESLPAVITPGRGIPVLISGLDYAVLRLLPSARIEKV